MFRKEELFDTYNAASISDINLESPNCAGDMALRGFAVKSLYDDFVFADYIDVDNGFIKDESGLVTIDTSANKTWRKARVLMIGPMCGTTKPGDIILFPNDKGMPCGEVSYIDVEGNPRNANNGIFLSEHRIFATLHNID